MGALPNGFVQKECPQSSQAVDYEQSLKGIKNMYSPNLLQGVFCKQ